MKKGIFLLSFIFIILLAATVQSAEQANLLLNAGFEDNTGEWWGDIDYWEKDGNTDWLGSVTANSYEGDWSFSIGNDYGESKASAYCLQVLCNPNNPDNLYPYNT